MTDRILTPVIALGLAFLVWVYTRSRDQEVIDNHPVLVDLEINPGQAAHYELEDPTPRTVHVSFSGPPSRIRELRAHLRRDEIHLKHTISIPEDRLQEDEYFDQLRIDPVQIPVPPGVVTTILESQNRIPVKLWRVLEKQLPVRLVHDGPERVEQEILEPSVVTIRGRKQQLKNLEQWPTQLLSISEKRAALQPVPVEETVALASDINGRTVRATPSAVLVRFTLKPRQTLREITEIPVQFLCPANFPYRVEFVNDRAGKVTVRVQGPASEDRPAVTAYVDLTARKFGPGLHAEEPLRIQLPPGFQLVGEPPRLSSFRLVPLDSVAKPSDTEPPN